MEAEKPRIVMLVDNKRRDLLVAALIAHHIRRLGGEPFLEPLEAYRAAIPAHRPHLFVFNHLLAGHLADYSGKLHQMGVKVAVLPNEALLYNPEVLRSNCRRHTDKQHIDLYFAWSKIHHDALREVGFPDPRTRIEIVGNARFDFYFAPWNRIFTEPKAPGALPRILFCTNFILAASINNKEEIRRAFKPNEQRKRTFEDTWEAVESQYRSRQKVLGHIEALLKAGKYDVVLRPHPGELAPFYSDWAATLPNELRSRLTIQREGPIFPAMLNCDLEISCETCTTSLESWIAGKPNIDLVFERHPILYAAESANKSPEVETPDELVASVAKHLAAPRQEDFRAVREVHLEKWLNSPDGHSSEKIARALVEVASTAQPHIDPHLTFSDHRRALKLRALQKLGLPISYDPFLAAKMKFSPKRYKAKQFTYEKAIKPNDVKEAEAMLAAVEK